MRPGTKILIVLVGAGAYWAGYCYEQSKHVTQPLPGVVVSSGVSGAPGASQGASRSSGASPKPRLSLPKLVDPYARLNPPNPLRWFSDTEIDQATDEVSLLPIFYEDRIVTMEIASALDDTLAEAWCSQYQREPVLDERTVNVYPILSIEIESHDGFGTIRVIDIEVLPDILPDEVRDCVVDALDGHQFESKNGPYAYRLKHVTQYYGFFNDLRDPRWPNGE